MAQVSVPIIEGKETEKTIWNHDTGISFSDDECGTLISELKLFAIRNYKDKKINSIDNAEEIYLKIDSNCISSTENFLRQPELHYQKISVSLTDIFSSNLTQKIYKMLSIGMNKFKVSYVEFVSFGSFSIIFGNKSIGQVPHIDVTKNCFQLILPLTNNSPTTLVCVRELTPMQVCDILRFKKEDAPVFEPWIEQYGSLALPFEQLELNPIINNPVNAGHMYGARGGLVHAGPKYDGHRAVLFMVAYKKDVINYDQDAQYNIFNIIFSLKKLFPSNTGVLNELNNEYKKKYETKYKLSHVFTRIDQQKKALLKK
uniref:Uncharacterized protein n=1 Tax=viral metagenome TaxID=1070528 RepID=A0A6C0F6K8_9ZZZZ